MIVLHSISLIILCQIEKSHLNKVVGEIVLTFEEVGSPTDVNSLIPDHFLIVGSLVALLQLNHQNIPRNRLSRCHYLTKMNQYWSSENLSCLILKLNGGKTSSSFRKNALWYCSNMKHFNH